MNKIEQIELLVDAVKNDKPLQHRYNRWGCLAPDCDWLNILSDARSKEIRLTDLIKALDAGTEFRLKPIPKKKSIELNKLPLPCFIFIPDDWEGKSGYITQVGSIYTTSLQTCDQRLWSITDLIRYGAKWTEKVERDRDKTIWHSFEEEVYE